MSEQKHRRIKLIPPSPPQPPPPSPPRPKNVRYDPFNLPNNHNILNNLPNNRREFESMSQARDRDNNLPPRSFQVVDQEVSILSVGIHAGNGQLLRQVCNAWYPTPKHPLNHLDVIIANVFVDNVRRRNDRLWRGVKRDLDSTISNRSVFTTRWKTVKASPPVLSFPYEYRSVLLTPFRFVPVNTVAEPVKYLPSYC